MKMVYCSKCTIGEEVGPSHAITSRQRMARVVAGAGWIALPWVLPRDWAPAITWLLAIVAAWFGISHTVAGLTGYPDCPELGAIASVVKGRYVQTRCGPWARLDRWLETRSRKFS